MVEKTFKIENRLGLHARPAALFAQTAGKYKSKVWIVKKNQKIDGKSVLGIMMLAAEHGTSVKIICEGHDEKEAIKGISEIFERKFDEE